MIFADTGGLFAIDVPNAPEHATAVAWLAGNTEPLVFTDYVFDELMTLMKARGEHARAYRFGGRLLDGRSRESSGSHPGMSGGPGRSSTATATRIGASPTAPAGS